MYVDIDNAAPEKEKHGLPNKKIPA